MRALRKALFSNLGLGKFSKFLHFQNSLLHLIFIFLGSARDAEPKNIKIKCNKEF